MLAVASVLGRNILSLAAVVIWLTAVLLLLLLILTTEEVIAKDFYDKIKREVFREFLFRLPIKICIY
jgi:hypothetical protein